MKQLLLLSFIAISLCSYSQAGKKRTKDLIDSLFNTDQFKNYFEQKRNSEILIDNFKGEKHTDEEVKAVKGKYAELQAKSDLFLHLIDNDLANKTKRKTIIKSPQAYLARKQAEFNKISEFYRNDFLSVYSKSAIASAGGIGLDDIPFKEILEFVFKLIKDAEVTVDFIKETFTNQLRYKSWDDIT